MVDTNFALRATFPVPGGAARKLWVVFAWNFEEVLPIGTPSDWVLAGSMACWDEYERKARGPAKPFNRKIDAGTAAQLLRRYQSVCVVAPMPAYAYDVPQLTSDPDDDLLVYDALRSGVDIFISDDQDVVPDEADGCKEYEHGASDCRRGGLRPAAAESRAARVSRPAQTGHRESIVRSAPVPLHAGGLSGERRKIQGSRGSTGLIDSYRQH